MGVMTSNEKDFGACAHGVCPLSVTRRCNVMIEMSVQPQFQVGDTGMLDPTALRRHHDANPQEDPRFSSAFRFKVYHCKQKNGNNTRSLDYVYEKQYICKQTKQKMRVDNMDYRGLCKYLRSISATHYINQNNIVSSPDRILAICKPCSTCMLPTGLCECKQTAVPTPEQTTVAVSSDGVEEETVPSIQIGTSSGEVNITMDKHMTDELAFKRNNGQSIEYFSRLFDTSWFKLADKLPDSALLYTASDRIANSKSKILDKLSFSASPM